MRYHQAIRPLFARIRGVVHRARAAEDRSGLCDWRARPRPRNVEVQRLVRARAVVVTDELAEHVPQMPLVHHDDVMRAFAPKGAHEPLGDADLTP